MPKNGAWCLGIPIHLKTTLCCKSSQKTTTFPADQKAHGRTEFQKKLQHKPLRRWGTPTPKTTIVRNMQDSRQRTVMHSVYHILLRAARSYMFMKSTRVPQSNISEDERVLWFYLFWILHSFQNMTLSMAPSLDPRLQSKPSSIKLLFSFKQSKHIKTYALHVSMPLDCLCQFIATLSVNLNPLEPCTPAKCIPNKSCLLPVTFAQSTVPEYCYFTGSQVISCWIHSAKSMVHEQVAGCGGMAICSPPTVALKKVSMAITEAFDEIN